jgi:amidophosphoribosyltransferase
MSIILGVYGVDAAKHASIGMQPLIRNTETERPGILTNWVMMSDLPDIDEPDTYEGQRKPRLSGIDAHHKRVFPSPENMGDFYGDMAVAQKCYTGETLPHFKPSTVGRLGEGVIVAFDGYITNRDEIETDMITRKTFDDLELDNRPVYCDGISDSELIYSLLAQSGKERLEDAIRNLACLEGSFNIIVATPTEMLALRDSKGTRPFYSESFSNGYVFAPETMPIDMIRPLKGENHGEEFKEVEPGEAVIVSRDGKIHLRVFPESEPRHCTRELIAYARNQSEVFGIDVSDFRREAGRRLARLYSDIAAKVDLVCRIGDTYSVGFAEQSKKPLLNVLQGLYQVGDIRYESGSAPLDLDGKYYVDINAVKGKKVALVERAERRDGRKLRAKIKALRDALVSEVHVFMGSESVITTPEGKSPCPYRRIGEDHKTADELANLVDADSFNFLPVEETYSIIETLGGNPSHFCTGCIGMKDPSQ